MVKSKREPSGSLGTLLHNLTFWLTFDLYMVYVYEEI